MIWQRNRLLEEAAKDQEKYEEFISWRRDSENRKILLDLKSLDSPISQLGNLNSKDSMVGPANYENSNFSGAMIEFLDFTGCDVANVDFTNSMIANVPLNGARNLEKAKGLETVGNFKVIYDFKLENYQLPGKSFSLLTWDRLRLAERLPILATSWSILALLPLYFSSVQYLNQIILWFDNRIIEGLNSATSKEILPSIPTIEYSWSLVCLFIGFLSFAIASTTFRLICPERVRLFSLSDWRDKHERNAINYIPLTWKFPKTRLVLSIFYVLGFLLVFGVGGWKILNSLYLISTNIK